MEQIDASRIFLSYTGAEEPLAKAISSALREYLTDTQVFDWRSTDTLSEEWLSKLKMELTRSRIVLFLLSPDSIRKQWILFEFGAAWFSSAETVLVPIFHSGLEPGHLHPPLSTINGLHAHDPHLGSKLLNKLSERFGTKLSASINDEEFSKTIQRSLDAIQAERQRYDLFISAPMAASSWNRMSRDGAISLFKNWRFRTGAPQNTENYRHEIDHALKEATRELIEKGKRVRYGGTDPNPDLSRTDKVKSGMDALRNSNAFLLVYPAEFATGALCEAGFAHALDIPSTYYVKEGLKVPSFLDATGWHKNEFTSAHDLRLAIVEKYGK